LNKTFI